MPDEEIIEQPVASPETDLPNHGVYEDLPSMKLEVELLKNRVVTLESK